MKTISVKGVNILTREGTLDEYIANVEYNKNLKGNWTSIIHAK